MDLLLAVGSRRRNNPLVQQLIVNAVRNLPVLRKADVDPDEMCAICLNSFETVFQEEADYVRDHKRSLGLKETSSAGEEDLLLGLTKVEHCGHTFCRRDLAEWIRGFHGNCPTCRHPFLEIPPESDDESEDGDYIPDEEDEQDYFDFSDYSEVDLLVSSEADMNEVVDPTEAAEADIDATGRESSATPSAQSEDEDEEPEAGPSVQQAPAPFRRGERIPTPPPANDLAAHFRLFRSNRVEPDPEGERLYNEQRRIQMMGPHLPPDWHLRQMDAQWERVAPYHEEEGARREEWRRQRLEEEAAADREILQRQLREVADQEEELAEDFADAVDAMDDELNEDEEDDVSSGSDTFMDAYLSDSSSDLDYQPEDYMMNSGSEESDSEYMSSDFDYGVDELECLDRMDDPVAIHDDSTGDTDLGLATPSAEKAAPLSDPVEHHPAGDRFQDPSSIDSCIC
ncbi:hypothetical protein NMY22_g2167 [Coprinellus aureogranulatus]|nr:hypothetical protein NMY22_g2167 [Coprinellus aureogranulatus]